jgi:RHS repeat-associated protein
MNGPDRLLSLVFKTSLFLSRSSILLGGILLATIFPTIASAAASANLSQCGNLANGLPTSCTWQNGNLNSNQAHWLEGDSVPYQMILSGLTPNTSYTITIGYATTKGGKHAIDYLTSYDRTMAGGTPSVSPTNGIANECSGVTGCTTPPNAFPIPLDPNLTSAGVTPVSGNFAIFNGTITAVGAYSLSGSYTSDSQTSIAIVFTSGPANASGKTNVVLAWGGHIATRADWGQNFGAVNISGSPYHTQLVSFSGGSGGSQDRALTAGAVIFPATIRIAKVAVPNGGTSFPFSISPALPVGTGSVSNFSLVNNGSSSNFVTYTLSTSSAFNVAYAFTESPLPGWSLIGLDCTVDQISGSTATVNGAITTITPKAAGVINCTYTNTEPVVAPPSFSPGGGTYTSVQTVTISSTTPGASIRFTTDGSSPSETAGLIYSGPVTVGSSETLKAIAFEGGMIDSAINSASYTINLPNVAAPTFSPGAGTYSTAQSVTIGSSTQGASIRYTVDGSTPSETAGTLYTSPVAVSYTTVLKAIAYKAGIMDSAITSATYTLPISVSVSPTTVTLSQNQTQQFTATVSGSPNTAVTWTIDPMGLGTVDSTGLYTAPQNIVGFQNITITATSQQDNTKTASATVTLSPMSPLAGPAGTLVTISGTGFGASEGSSSVTVGGLPAVALTWTDSQIVAQVPTGTTLGGQPVVVTVGGQLQSEGTFTVAAGLVGINPSLDGTPASVTISSSGQSAPLIFYGNAGQIVSSLFSNYAFPNGTWDRVTLSIVRSDGATIGSSDIYSNSIFGTKLFEPPITLPSTDIYTLRITPSSGSTGSASLRLWLFSDKTATITSGVPVPAANSIPGQKNILTFNGTAGQLASVLLTDFNIPAPGINIDVVTVSILKPDGSTLISTNMYSCCGGRYFQNSVMLPQTGTYKLVFDPQGGLTGSATVGLWLFQNQVGTITPGNPTASSINIPGQLDLRSFFGGAGQTASLLLTDFNYPTQGINIDVTTVSILNPDGTTLVSTGMYSCCGGKYYQGPVTLPTAGTYTVVIAPQNGVTGSSTVLLTMSSPKLVTMTAGLTPVESYFGTTVLVKLNLTTGSAAVPTGAVTCTGSGITSAAVPVNQLGGAVVPMNGLPIGKDAIACSFTSNDPTVFFNATSAPVVESVTPAPTAGSVSVSPVNSSLFGGQNEQFTASVFNSSNQLVTWRVSPADAGTINSSGLYSAPISVTVPQTVMIVATSQADSTKIGTAAITLTPPQCAASGYGYQRSIVVDHSNVPNSDQTDFPFLFNTTDASLASTSNGGHVANSSGYDIFFSTDPAGLTKLDHELAQYDPVHGTVIAWVRIPTLSHSADTVIYMFYGNPAVSTSQQNPTGVWDSGFAGVYHLTNTASGVAADSSANENSATVTSASSVTGIVDSASNFNGASSYMQVPAADFQTYPTSGSTSTAFSASFGAWFKTATGGVILGQTDGTAPGGTPGQWQPALYIDNAGHLRASMFAHESSTKQIVTTPTYTDNLWHFVVDTYTNGSEQLYVDGQFAGAQQVTENGYSSVYSYFAGAGETANWPATNGSWSYFNGILDEINVSSTARSADWIQAQYRNQSSPSTFYSVHSENAVEVLPSVVNLYDSQHQQFTVLGSTAGSCTATTATWSMPSGMQGTLTTAGLYTAPDTISSQQTIPITATILGAASRTIAASVTLSPAVHVSLNPGIVALTSGQTQQFAAAVSNSVNTAVTWSLNPVGAGTVSSTGLYTAPAGLVTQATVIITATSQADPNQSASSTISLSPTQIPFSSNPCSSSGFAYQRVIVIDHTKVPNADQENFPFLFNSMDSSLASTSNGGQVSSSSGNDIFFSSDANGITKLDHELESYDPVHGHVIAWVRIPRLSHSADTVLYMFYGNQNVTWPQQNPNGVWDSNFTGVYHLSVPGTNINSDSTTNSNNLTALTSVPPVEGMIAGGSGFNGSSSSAQVPERAFPNFPFGTYNQIGLPDPGNANSFSTTFGVWFKTASPGGILMQSVNLTCTFGVFGICVNTGPMQAGAIPDGSWDAMVYIDENGHLNAGGLVSPNAYTDNNWHFAVWSFSSGGTNSLFVDGQNVAKGGGTAGAYAGDYAYYLGAAYTFEARQGNWNWLYFNGSLDEVTVSDVPRSADWIKAEYNNQSSPSTFYSFNPTSSAQVVPSSATLYGSQLQQFAVTAACGGQVNWSMPAGTPGTLSSNGLYTAPAQVTSQQSAVITATRQSDGTTIGTATLSLLPPPSPLTLTTVAPGPYTVGTVQSFSATLLDQDGTPESGVPVVFSVSGSNNTIGSGTTGDDGVATFAYTGSYSGTDTIHANAVAIGQTLDSNSVSISWIVPTPQIAAARVTLVGPPAMGATGLVGAFADQTGRVIEPLAIGSAPASLIVPVGATQLLLGVDGEYFPTNGGPGFVVAVNGVSVTVPATAMPWTWTIGGLNNSYQYGIYNPGIQSGILDGTSPVVAATGLTQGAIVRIAYQSGSASPNYPLAPLVGANGDETALTGVGLWQGTYYPTLYTTTSSYPAGQPVSFDAVVTDASGAPMSNVPVTLTVTGPNAQLLNATTDSTGTAAFLYVGINSGTDSLEAQAYPSGGPDLLSSQSNITWVNYPTPPVHGALQLQLLGSVENRQDYGVLATDSSGTPVQNASVALYAWGVDNFVQTGTTDITGHVAFKYMHATPGTYNLVAVEAKDRNIVFSNVVPGQWAGPGATNGSGNAITIGITGNTSVIMPNTLQVNGTVTDGSGLTPTITWSEISGPGVATFANPSQAVTTVSFSDLGTYVLALSASDASGNHGSVQWTIQVNPPLQDPQGWVASPVYGSTVTGIVPIKLAPGVSLQSGILTYYPADSNNGVTVLNSNTTGSGQIGSLDTTQLPNGSYWIQLQATDAQGNSEYGLVLVTVAGGYKPGRVTAAVTDLVVPSSGVAINIQRSYDSLNAATSGDFGYGWNLGINTNLTVDPAGNVTFTLNGQRKTFYLAPRFNGFLPYYDVAYSPEPGLHGTLTDSGPGCADFFDFVLPYGSIWVCVNGGEFAPPGYIYTDTSGTAYSISAAGNLQSIRDRNGNGITVTANGITSTTGLSVPFVRDSQNRITKITDPQGNIYQYGYDASGNLETVTYPNTSTPSTYTYDTQHRYLSGIDARSNPLPVTTYYASTDTDSNGLPLNGRLHSVQDALGQTTSYAYDLLTNTTTITYPPDGSGNVGTATMVYDSYGLLLSATDPLNHTITNVYDANRNLTSVTDQLGHVTKYTYDSNGNRVSTTYPATATSTNTTSTTTYNQYGEPTSTTDELGNVRQFQYDANYNPRKVSDGLGALASFQFDPDGTLQAGAVGYDIATSPSRASQFAYDADGNLTNRTDALGRVTSYTYDSLGHKLTSTTPTTTSRVGGPSSTTNYQYDSVGNLTQTDAPLGRTTSSTFDANGNKLTDTDARGKTTTYNYDALNRVFETDYPDTTKSTKTFDFRGNVVTETDQGGHVTKNVYDLAGRLSSTTRAFGTADATTTNYSYDDAGRKTGETDSLGHATTYGYDAAGNLTSVSGVGGTFTYAYDNARNRISMTDGNGYTTQYQYDARKRLTVTTYPDQTTRTNAYDGPGNLISVTDQAGKEVRYNYDAANQLVNVVQVDSPNTGSNTTVYGYDALGNAITLEDANTHTTQQNFDLLGDLTGKTLPDASLSESRQYDNNGNLTSMTQFNGAVTTYTYDNLNRLLSRSTPNEPTVSFTYTATGKRHTMADASGTTTYNYDNMDRLTSKQTPEGALSYSYDAAGHVASISSSNANGANVSYTYDSLNRLHTVVDSRLGTTTYTYDPANNVATVTYPNSVQSTFAYDQLNRVMGLATAQTGYVYQRGPTGNLTSGLELNNRQVTWNYDGIYRLTSETVANAPSGKNGAATYGLDPVGNRTSGSSSISGLSPVSGSYNQDDQLASESYDQNGNVIAANGKTFTYDSQNQLVSMNGGAVQIMYDGDGNRVAKSVSGVTTYFLVDDLNPTGYAQVMDELAGSVVKRTYTYGMQRIAQEQVISNTWTPSFYGYDGGGNVRQLTNAAGAITDTNEFDAFGNLVNFTGTTPNHFMYRGEEFDSDLGLYYLRARYYNPLSGRFMSRDPYDGNKILPMSLHKYLYAGGNPVNKVDPRGRDLFEYSIRTNAAFPEAKLIDVYGCVANAGLAAVDLILAGPYDPNDTTGNVGAGLGIGSTVVGCVSLMPGLNQLARAGSKIVENAQWASLAVGWLSCAADAEDVVNGLNDAAAGSPKAADEISKAIEHLGGCVGTELGELLKRH